MRDGDLRAYFQSNLPEVHWQPIESALVGPGIPDLNGCFRGRDFWIEAKATPAWAVDISKEQCAWLRRRIRAGGTTFVAVRRLAFPGPRRPAADELWLIWGDAAQELRKEGLKGVGRDAILGVWVKGPKNWDWARVLRILAEEPRPNALPPYRYVASAAVAQR